MTSTIHLGDNREIMMGMEDCSVDSIVTDPPAGIHFMNMAFDHHKGGRDQWVAWMADVMRECHRVLKPGGHALVWALPRTSHWTATAVEDAGFEIRDVCVHLFGSGFPKSANVSKMIDKAAGAEREKIPATGGLHKNRNLNDDGWSKIGSDDPLMDSSIPTTPEAQQWEGWHTALKPAFEPWILAQKPINTVVDSAKIDQNLGLIEEALCEFIARNADDRSIPRPRGSSEENPSTALRSARIFTEESQGPKTRIGGAENTSSVVDMSGSMWEVGSIALNTISSWRNTWGEACRLVSTSTTVTASSLTIDLKIWNSLLSQIIPDDIIRAVSNPDGSHALVSRADVIFNAVAEKLNYIQTLSAQEHVGAIVDSSEELEHEPRRNDSETKKVGFSSPAAENWIIARKPLAKDHTVAANVLAHGTGAINVDGCRIGNDGMEQHRTAAPGTLGGNGIYGTASEIKNSKQEARSEAGLNPRYDPAGRWPPNVALSCCGNDPHDLDCAAAMLDAQSGERGGHGVGTKGTKYPIDNAIYSKFGYDRAPFAYGDTGGASRFMKVVEADPPIKGRWPANVVLDEEAAAMLDAQSGVSKGGNPTNERGKGGIWSPSSGLPAGPQYGDTGGASRFFYTAKASRAERNAGLEGMPERLKLRDDLTPEQRAWVLTELVASGVAL